MIKNERQRTTAKNKHEALISSADTSDGLEADVLRELADELREQIEEYDAITSGQVTAFNFQSLDELAEIVCKARISKGLTQRELSEILGVSEQMVQRDEAGNYEGAGLARVAEVFDALGYLVRGSVCAAESEPSYFHFHAKSPKWDAASSNDLRTSLSELFRSDLAGDQTSSSGPAYPSDSNRSEKREVAA